MSNPVVIYEPEFDFNQPDAQDTHRQKFWAYNRAHPEIYWAIKAHAASLLDLGESRLSMKGIFEALRGKFPHLNNSYTGDYTDLLIMECPRFDGVFERRSRANKRMKKVPVRAGDGR